MTPHPRGSGHKHPVQSPERRGQNGDSETGLVAVPRKELLGASLGETLLWGPFPKGFGSSPGGVVWHSAVGSSLGQAALHALAALPPSYALGERSDSAQREKQCTLLQPVQQSQRRTVQLPCAVLQRKLIRSHLTPCARNGRARYVFAALFLIHTLTCSCQKGLDLFLSALILIAWKHGEGQEGKEAERGDAPLGAPSGWGCWRCSTQGAPPSREPLALNAMSNPLEPCFGEPLGDAGKPWKL